MTHKHRHVWKPSSNADARAAILSMYGDLYETVNVRSCSCDAIRIESVVRPEVAQAMAREWRAANVS